MRRFPSRSLPRKRESSQLQKLDSRLRGSERSDDNRERLIKLLQHLFVAICVLILTIWSFAPLLISLG